MFLMTLKKFHKLKIATNYYDYDTYHYHFKYNNKEHYYRYFNTSIIVYMLSFILLSISGIAKRIINDVVFLLLSFLSLSIMPL